MLGPSPSPSSSLSLLQVPDWLKVLAPLVVIVCTPALSCQEAVVVVPSESTLCCMCGVNLTAEGQLEYGSLVNAVDPDLVNSTFNPPPKVNI